MFSERFYKALELASRLHRGQLKKTSGKPYVGHLLSVTGMVIQNGGDEDEVVAALLHDAIEDQGGTKTGKLIREQFGDKVADVVWACTDWADGVPKESWIDRKKKYLEHLKNASKSELLISVADKLDNTRIVLNRVRKNDKTIWEKMNGSMEDRIWYYKELVNVYRQTEVPQDLVDELEALTNYIVNLINS